MSERIIKHSIYNIVIDFLTFNNPDLLSGDKDKRVETLLTDLTSNPLSSLLSLTLKTSLSD
jgi:hypothetical protein